MMCRKCSWCQVKWPYTDDFVRCPQCQENTESKRDNPDFNEADAQAMKTEAEFGWYLLTRWLQTPA
jgi:hypothetical protein